MIVFELECANGHTFEGWFADGQDFETQQERQLVACPLCDDTHISKRPSAFAIKSSGSRSSRLPSPAELEVAGRQLVAHLERNFDDVGCDFAKEALKIHYGAAEARNIRGKSTREEEKMLEKEGVSFFKIPLPPVSDADA